MKTKNTPGRVVFSIFNYVIFGLLVLLCLYPLWYIFVQSLSSSNIAGKGILLPYKTSFVNYTIVFKLPGVFPALGVSIARVVIGTGMTVISCMMLGYLFSKREMVCRKFLYRMLTLTMYVSGGLIPCYLTFKAYGMLNTFWVYILPSMLNAYYVILIKTFVEQLPASVEESAMLDGAGTLTIFFRIIMPMSLPIMATIAVYAAVAQWNSWFDNLIYNFGNEKLTTMQYLLYQYLSEAERLAKQLAESSAETSLQNVLTPKGIKMTVTIITVVPVLLIYPFLQRYFIKGIMIGAVKG